jgi:hypothetical protein
VQPAQQQGRRLPLESSVRALSTRQLRVCGFLAYTIQHSHSLRASGVISSHAVCAATAEIRTFFKSAGILCTTPPAILFLTMRLFYQMRVTFVYRGRLFKVMIENITLKLFWTMMLLCASSALTFLWFGDVIEQRLIPTFFILGFASFLIWTPVVVYKFLNK